MSIFGMRILQLVFSLFKHEKKSVNIKYGQCFRAKFMSKFMIMIFFCTCRMTFDDECLRSENRIAIRESRGKRASAIILLWISFITKATNLVYFGWRLLCISPYILTCEITKNHSGHVWWIFINFLSFHSWKVFCHIKKNTVGDMMYSFVYCHSSFIVCYLLTIHINRIRL